MPRAEILAMIETEETIREANSEFEKSDSEYIERAYDESFNELDF